MTKTLHHQVRGKAHTGQLFKFITCHGTGGIGSLKIPELNSLKKSDILESLNGFKTGEEKSTIMDKHAKAYTDAEIKLLADYFVSLKK